MKRGNFHGNQVLDKMSNTKTNSDIADTIGENERTTRRMLKLHDLIPQLQRLVSAGNLGTTAGVLGRYAWEGIEKVTIIVT